jgi:Spy/CpxP family protein refolding chaperone
VNSWKVILATIVIFGAGVVTGGLLVNYVMHSSHRHPLPPPVIQPDDGLPPQIRAEMLKKQFVQQLDDKLNLTKEQREQIQKIIADAQQNSRDLWKLVAPQFKALMQDTRQQIREVLTPEQRKQFEMLMKQQHPLRHPPYTNAPSIMPSAPTNGPSV